MRFVTNVLVGAVALLTLVAASIISGLYTDRGAPAEFAATAVVSSASPATESDVLAPSESPGRFRTANAFVCLQTQTNAAVILRHEGSHELPPWAGRATVFLNGWRLKYLNGDHHVRGLFVELANVRIEGNMLRWRARGRLFDKNDDDAYEFCYTYTVLAWNPMLFDVRTHELPYRYLDRSTDALLEDEVVIDTPPTFQAGDRITQLPRRFSITLAHGVRWTWLPPGACWECPIDREVLQVAFSRTELPTFNPSNEQIQLRWGVQAVFTDNGPPNDVDTYLTSEQVALIGGRSVIARQTPFDLEPASFSKPWYQTCVSGDGSSETESFEVDNVAGDHALPVLSGFELTYNCGEHHVREIGARIVDFSFERAPGATTGTLRYRLESVLRDKSGQPNHLVRHNVSVLSFSEAPLIQ